MINTGRILELPGLGLETNTKQGRRCGNEGVRVVAFQDTGPDVPRRSQLDGLVV